MVIRNWFATWLWGWGEKKWAPGVSGEGGESTGLVHPLADPGFRQCEAQVTLRNLELRGSRYWPPAEKGSVMLEHTVNKALNKVILNIKSNRYENHKDKHHASVRLCVKMQLQSALWGNESYLVFFCINLMISAICFVKGLQDRVNRM